MEDQKPYVKNAVTELIDSKTDPDSPRLAGFLIDMFCTPMIDVADEFGLPTYVFYTSGAGFLGFMFHLQSLHDNENVDTTEFAKTPNIELPISSFVNPVPASVFPGVVLDKTSVASMMMHTRDIRNRTKGILVNTFMELEYHAIQSLSDAKSKFPPLYPVGPILNLNRVESDRKSDVIEWLEGQPHSSVLFLCFGSMGSFNEPQIKEIAIALEQSGVRFLWSLRRPPSKDKMVMNGDCDVRKRVKEMSGKSRTVLVEGGSSHSSLQNWINVELKLSVEIKLDYRTGFYTGADDEDVIVTAQEIETGIRKLMEAGSDVRKRVKEISEKSKQAFMDGGSSYSSLRSFIETVIESLPSI
ncbi:hypothetical protein FEM48_Zijuj04G0151700 [Ziziphus jujuba var. spinosa]|uniref:Uncharacterized protein n=1 Tax=Ziziphus jujuba var. spinosa TaxID=714518 RepID=A0A978VKK8_ZIZJJ|nr:hypothetical protein FEM48_Zijuj04G0151700 [Ziziphus jujuba var. spinosa]